MVRRSEVSATRQHNGSWEVAAMVNGHRESRVYYDATRDEAIDEFIEEMDRLYAPSKVQSTTAGRFFNDPEDVQWLKDVHLKGPLAKSFRNEVKSFVLYGNEDSPDKVHIYATKDPNVDTRYYIVRFNERGNIRDVSGAGGRKQNPDLHGVRQIASNMTEAVHGTATILYSYQTPVAVHVEGIGYFRTAEKFSVTTSRHINKWLESHGARGATVVPQDEIVKLAKKGGQGAGDVRGTTTSYTDNPPDGIEVELRDYKDRLFTTDLHVREDASSGPGWYIFGRDDRTGVIKLIARPSVSPRRHPHYNIQVRRGWMRKKDATEAMGIVQDAITTASREGRLPPSLMRLSLLAENPKEQPDRFVYRGYSIQLGTDRETWYISKDGVSIGSARSLEEVRNIIAELRSDFPG